MGIFLVLLGVQNCLLVFSRYSVRIVPFVDVFFFFLINFIYLFLAALFLHCCRWAFPSCSERGLLFITVHGVFIVVASLVAEHGL